ncbi:hypothetical protein KY285_037830 [Solanum tuberosum]|nr:hypothetical protein KY285_037830 [Solanum tuberosum]
MPENLPADSELPGVDVFICTADPTKEPVLEVMNTVLSAMSLDYPSKKLSVYLSDDGGATVTLYAIKEACGFARVWVPFCRKYGVKTICPDAFFSSFGDDERLILGGNEFKNEEENIKAAYEVFKKNVEKTNSIEGSVRMDRPPYIEVIHDDKESKLPQLVYMSRERRPSSPHRFKAGALNALLRVSGVMSNAPYMLVLDCDMYCNDPSSAKQAMCFHLDQNISTTLSYVQFPQTFYNVSKNDIYDSQSRSAYKNKYQGMDGVGGTVCAGTGYYLKKEALYSTPINQDNMTTLFLKAQSEYKWESQLYQSEESLQEAEEKFGASRKFINSINSLNDQRNGRENVLCDETIDEAKTLASCTFEENTRWGKEIGYSYSSLLESSYTGYLLHSKGWKSVYLYPKRPCFLGCSTIDMKDALVQLMKWASGLVQVGLSKYSPLTYGLMSKMPLVQNMCYGYFMFSHFLSIPCFLYGIVPPLCFLMGTPVFPKVTSPWFALFTTIFLSSLAQHLYEVLSSGGNLRTWWNEQRIWIIKTVTACLFGCLDVLMKWLGVAKANFRLTNKAIDEEKLRKYEKVVFNVVCFIFGMKRLVLERNFEEMFGQEKKYSPLGWKGRPYFITCAKNCPLFSFEKMPPLFFFFRKLIGSIGLEGVARMVNTPHFQPEGCEFESLREQKGWELLGKESSSRSLEKKKEYNLLHLKILLDGEF